MFGKDSKETSNCYFMMGSYFMENEEYNKAIACYIRASEMRADFSGDCYYNLGIIFHILKKQKISIQMFENALKMRELEFGENSVELADVYHNIALIHQNMKNYKAAI